MYNLSNLQLHHPRLKKLNNWTGCHGDDFLDGFGSTKSFEQDSTSSCSQSNDRSLERTGNVGGLSRKRLPPISVLDTEVERLEFNGTTTLAKFCGPLPPIVNGSKSNCVYEQASKHLQDYHEDVRRVDECLENTRQKQIVSLQEKIKTRQKLKEAEKEEEKQKGELEKEENPKTDEVKEEGKNDLIMNCKEEAAVIGEHQVQGKQSITEDKIPPSVQRNNSITLVKIEGKRRRKLYKFIKFSFVLLVLSVFGITMSLLGKHEDVPDNVRRSSNNSTNELSQTGRQKAEKPEKNSQIITHSESIKQSHFYSIGKTIDEAVITPSSLNGFVSSVDETVITSLGYKYSEISSTLMTRNKWSTAPLIAPSRMVLTAASSNNIKHNKPSSLLLSTLVTNMNNVPSSSTTYGSSMISSTSLFVFPTNLEIQSVSSSSNTWHWSSTLPSSSEINILSTSSSLNNDNLEEAMTESEDICLTSSTTSDVYELHMRIQRMIQRLNRLLIRRYLLIVTPRDVRRGRNLMKKVCDLIQNPGANVGMLMVDLQTMTYLLMDLLGITDASCQA